jgi:hypothetical protein
MKSRRIRSCLAAWLGGVVAVSATACSDSSERENGDDPAGGEKDSARPVCPRCTNWAGGETSDFGNISELLAGGNGSHAEPTPCQLSERVSSIDDAAARALGFGASLDRLVTSFDLPFEWTAKELVLGDPATGYTPATRLSGSTRVVGLRHVSPTLAGCEDSLLVTVETSLEMGDGALSIEGQLSAQVTAEDTIPVVAGLLDLSAARGTLEMHPPSSEESLVGYVQAFLYLWPDGVRGWLRVAALNPSDIGSDSPGYSYQPLEGRAPVDACQIEARPLAFHEPISWTGGESLADRYPEVRGWLEPSEPFQARWSTGAATSVSTALGEPFEICDDRRQVVYKVPLGISSADGRVSIQRDATAVLRFEAGAPAWGWLEVYPVGVVEEARGFADATGISGVDFGELGGGLWHTELYLERPEVEPRVKGEVTIEGVDIDGHVTGTEFAITGELESLRW